MSGGTDGYPFHSVELNNIPVGSTAVGEITAQVRTPSNAMHLPHIEDNGNGSVGVFYQPTEVGPHNLDVRNNGEHVQGSPFKFYASPNDEGKVYAHGPGLSHAVCGDSANFVISTKGKTVFLCKYAHKFLKRIFKIIFIIPICKHRYFLCIEERHEYF